MDFNQVFYQIYPLGMCGCPAENDGIRVHRIRRIRKWIPHFLKLGITAIYFSPLFESDRHGYDTRNYAEIDCRLGDNRDFMDLCNDLHDNGISVVLDGVFNHVGRGFWAFQDVLQKRENSAYRDWFYIDFNDGSQPDGFRYDCWEGHGELVKLNLDNPDVKQHLFDCIDQWIDRFHIDGLRLDVAYCLNPQSMKELHQHVKSQNPDFFLLGEMIHGDYRNIVNPKMLDSATNYECCKGLYSSMNTHNLFEISYSLNRQFGSEQWCLYTGLPLFSFADNHDIDRLASVLNDREDLALSYALLFAMPGIPCIYYGSEWGIEGRKENGSDAGLRPDIEKPQWNELCSAIADLASLRKKYQVLYDGDYANIYVNNKQLLFRRRNDHEQMVFALNIDDEPCTIPFDIGCDSAVNPLTEEKHSAQDPLIMPGKSASYWYSSFTD